MINHNEEAVLIDFGVSALIDHQANDELKNVMMGTLKYYAPEMIKTDNEQQKPIRGELTDIWAMGITLFNLVTGRCPY